MVLQRLRLQWIILGGAVAYFYGLSNNNQPETFPVQGTVAKGFEATEAAFKANYAEEREKQGSAFAVYHKAVCALSMAMLVDRGLLDYDGLVTDYWPAFGANGKDNVTVAMLFSHKSGLAWLDAPISQEMVRDKDWKSVGALIEAQRPGWPPGQSFGYHALTHGFLAEQIMRRVDPKMRSLGLDFHLGLPKTEYHRVSKQEPPSGWEMIKKLFQSFNLTSLKIQLGLLFSGASSEMGKAFGNPSWLVTTSGRLRTNDPDVLNLELGSANGVTTARALAHIFSLFEQGQLVKNPEVRKGFKEPRYVQNYDRILGLTANHGYGFGYSKSPLDNWEFGHPGYGGQNVKVNLEEQLAFAYLTNGLTPDMGDGAACFSALRAAVYEDVKRIK